MAPRGVAGGIVVALCALGGCRSPDEPAAAPDGARAGAGTTSVGGDGSGGAGDPPRVEPSGSNGGRPELTVDMSWQWQLQGEVDTHHDVDLYDIDLFDVPDTVIDELHADGRIVVCYFSAGSVEDWRGDAADFDPADVGAPLDGWPGERWVDVRSGGVRSIIGARLDLAVERGCDGVEPDNVDAYDHDTGFAITPDDQLDFNRFLADSARARGLLVGLKNDVDQIPELVDSFDFAVNEQCVELGECDPYAAFVDAGRPVFGAEYATEFVDDPTPACAVAERERISLLVLPEDLDGSFRIDCD